MERTRDFATLRGGTPDTRADDERPYTPASYAAQYGVPREDLEAFFEKYGPIDEYPDMEKFAKKHGVTHGDVKQFIVKEFINSNPEFRANALALEVRPMETRQQRRDRLRKEEKTLQKKEKQLEREKRDAAKGIAPRSQGTSIDTFSRPGGFIADWKEKDVDNFRRIFKLGDWTNEDLDTFAEYLQELPGGEWLDGHDQNVKRCYALTCLNLKEQDPAKFDTNIVHGEAWNNYG